MTDERIIAYLLEELAEEEQERFEDDCFAQNSWPAEIDLVEEDLIDAYLRNELIPERRQRFERNYLITPARQERVRVAAALLRQIDARNPQGANQTLAERFVGFWRAQTWGLRAATAIATLFVVSVTVWLLSRTPSPRTFASLTLTISNSNRGERADIGRVKLPLNADALRIALTLPPQASSATGYRVELENGSRENRSTEIAGSDAQFIFIVIPSAQLAPGEYALRLFANKTDGTEQRISGSYFFTVE